MQMFISCFDDLHLLFGSSAAMYLEDISSEPTGYWVV